MARDGIEISPTADSLYDEGCALVEECDRLHARSIDPEVPEDFRRAAAATLTVKQAQARSRFRRHDMLLDNIARREEQTPK